MEPSKECIPKHFGNSNHPVCAAAEASHLFLNSGATPPVSGGELPASHLFTPSITVPTYASSMSFATASSQEGWLRDQANAA
jgi:hypothetical protein